MNSSSAIPAAEATLGINRYTAALVCAGGVLSILTIHIARSYGSTSGIFSLVLGSGRNFMAALCMPAAVPALASRLLRENLPCLSPQRWALVCLAVTQLFFVAWEFLQLVVRSMVFDVKDLGATVLGGIFWLALAKTLPRGVPA